MNASFRHALVLGLSVLLLAGCAGERAFHRAGDLLETAQYDEALKQYRVALAAEPNNSEFRIGYLRARDRVVQKWLGDANLAQSQGRSGEAVALYRQVLQLDPNNALALGGVRAIDRDNRHAQLIAEAQGVFIRGDLDGALARLRIVLGENPKQPVARELLATIDAQRAQSRMGDVKLAEAFRKPISIEFRDAQLRQVFEVLSRDSGLNFVLDKEVRGDQRTTLFLRNTTIANALALTLLTNQLEQRILDTSTVLIYPATGQKQRDYQALSVRSFVLGNADAKTVANTLRTILKSRDVVVDEKQNMIIMRDSPESIRMAEKLIALHDQPPPEVMLEVEILEVQRTSLLSLGVQYPTQLSLSPLTTVSGSTTSALTLNQLLNLNSNTIGATVDSLGVTASHKVSDVKVLANPRIRCLSREKAKIVVGKRAPTVTTTTTTTSTTSSVQYLDVGLKLSVEPTVFPDGEVTIKLDLEVSSILSKQTLKDGTVAYEVGTRNADTVLRLHDGENQVLAGLLNDNQNNSGNRVPGLGDVPGLGRLFSYNSEDGEKSELLLSITPRIVRSAERPPVAQAEFEAGTETSIRSLNFGEIPSPAPAPVNVPAAPPAPTPVAPPPSMPVPAPRTGQQGIEGESGLALRTSGELDMPPVLRALDTPETRVAAEQSKSAPVARQVEQPRGSYEGRDVLLDDAQPTETPAQVAAREKARTYRYEADSLLGLLGASAPAAPR